MNKRFGRVPGDLHKALDLRRSVWAATARPGPVLPALSGDMEAEVAILGAGFTGLSTAHHLRKANIDCVVLEANSIGWGASGRNGGMAVLRYKKGFSVLAAKYGDESARQLYMLIHEAVNTLEAIIVEHSIECDFNRCGHITAAHSQRALAMLEADCRWLSDRVDDSIPVMLDRNVMRSRTGTAVYHGGFFDSRSAGIHPLNYVRGLAASLAQRNVPIFVATPAVELQVDRSGVTIVTPNGRVRSKQVIIATNAYSDLLQFGVNLNKRIVPVSSSVIATEPLRFELAAATLPTRQLITDTRHLTNYFRVLPDNRLLYGGRGDLTGRDTKESYHGLERHLVDTFPRLKNIGIEHRWSGMVAVTIDAFPHLGRLGEHILYAMGYGGRGVALTNLLGKRLAHLAQGGAIDCGPMSAGRFAPIPFHAWRIPGMKVVASYYRWLDQFGR